MSKPTKNKDGSIDTPVRQAMQQILANGGEGTADVSFVLADIPWKLTVEVDVEKLLIMRGVA